MLSLISPYVLGVVALVLSVLRLVLTAARSPVRSIPGPWYCRFTQVVLKYHTIRGRRMYYVDDLHRRYGPIVRIAPDEAAVSGLQPTQMIHKVGSGFNKSSFYDAITAQRHDSEPGIFSMRGGKQHAARRRLFARPFSQNSLQANWESVIQSKVRLAVNRIREEAGAEGEADILKWWTLMATDVIAHLSFGESFRMLELGRVCCRDQVDCPNFMRPQRANNLAANSIHRRGAGSSNAGGHHQRGPVPALDRAAHPLEERPEALQRGGPHLRTRIRSRAEHAHR